MKVYKYKWTRNYRVSPQVAGAIFQKLKNDEAVLEEASRPESPMHGDFDWDDSSAARAHRLHQVRTMRCSLSVEIITKKKQIEYVNAFVRRIDKVGYVSTLEATPAELTAAEQMCFREMSKFKQRFRNLQFAREVIEAIGDKERSVNRAPGRKLRRA